MGTDVIVGFPTETDADFEETLTLLDEVAYDTVYSFTYSERPGTSAVAHGDPLALTLKFERLRRLQARQKEIQQERNRTWVGKHVAVLVEGRSKRNAARWTGRTPENRIVHFAGESATGRVEQVTIRASTAFSLSAEFPEKRA